MVSIWSDETKYRIHFEIEAHAADALAELGVIPKEAAVEIWAKGNAAKIDPDRIVEIEKETRHETLAFTTHLAELIGPAARFVHQGLTSSDVLDTTTAVQLARASDILIADVDALLAALKKRALEHKYTLTIGRSHGIHGEPTTFGVKLAGFYAEFTRNKDRLKTARAEIATCAISGAMGTFANVDPRVEAHVAAKLGLSVEPVSTQVIPRDRHAAYFAALAVVASSLERLATEVRHLQRTEVLEAQEFFAEGQKGSSAMPHKRNPVVAERICGLARVVRAAATVGLENVALWHERDISHSSAERVVVPDAFLALDYMLDRFGWLVEGLVVRPERMRRNLDSSHGLFFSQRLLLALVESGLTRDEAYRLVQRHALQAWDEEQDFRELVRADRELAGRVDLAAVFDLTAYTRHVDTVFERLRSLVRKEETVHA